MIRATLNGPAITLIPFLVGTPTIGGITTDHLLLWMLLVALILPILAMFPDGGDCADHQDGGEHVH